VKLDPEEIGRLYQQHGRGLIAYACSFLSRFSAAEDVVCICAVPDVAYPKKGNILGEPVRITVNFAEKRRVFLQGSSGLQFGFFPWPDGLRKHRHRNVLVGAQDIHNTWSYWRLFRLNTKGTRAQSAACWDDYG
jgi:hypothetical protein